MGGGQTSGGLMGGGGGLMGGAAAAQAGGQAGAAGAVAAQLPQGTDTITSITWQAQSQFFAVAGWDHKVRRVAMPAQGGSLLGTEIAHGQTPLPSTGVHCAAAKGAERRTRRRRTATSHIQLRGTNSGRCVAFGECPCVAGHAAGLPGHAPLCHLCSQAANAVFLAGAAKNVQMWDVQSGKGSVVAQVRVEQRPLAPLCAPHRRVPYALPQHAAVIRHCKWMSQANMLATSGLDGTIRLWDVRAPKMAAEVPQTLLRERVWAMDVTFPYMTAVTADKQVHMFDLNKGTQAVFRSMKSPLSKQVTCLSMVKHGQQPSFVMGSMEGRVSVRYFDANLDKSKKKFSMKAHRTKQDGTTASDGTIIYPVHTVEFFTNAQFGSCFLTGGGDGSFSVWDKDRMSRPMHCPGLGLPVTASGFSPDGSMLAVALGNDWLKGAAASMQVQQPTQVRVQPITAASLSGTS